MRKFCTNTLFSKVLFWRKAPPPTMHFIVSLFSGDSATRWQSRAGMKHCNLGGLLADQVTSPERPGLHTALEPHCPVVEQQAALEPAWSERKPWQTKGLPGGWHFPF